MVCHSHGDSIPMCLITQNKWTLITLKDWNKLKGAKLMSCFSSDVANISPHMHFWPQHELYNSINKNQMIIFKLFFFFYLCLLWETLMYSHKIYLDISLGRHTQKLKRLKVIDVYFLNKSNILVYIFLYLCV